jgi:hypothetical protein
MENENFDLTETNEKTVVIILVKNGWERLVQQSAWFAVLVACMSFAVLVDSQAMQWAMGFIWLMTLISFVLEYNKRRRCTPEQAIAEIQRYIETGK